MAHKRYVVVLIASLSWFAGIHAAVGADALASPLVLAQATDLRQEDRALERRADRQADNRQDRQQDAPAQVSVTLPRGPDGTIDNTALLDTLIARFAAGAREIQIRDASLTQQEAQDLFLALAPGQNLLSQIANVFPAGPGEFQVRFRNAVDARVQREPDGGLRMRVENIDLSGLSATERAALAQQLSQQTGFDRVRLQGTDAEGNRVRVEFRADKGLVQNVVQGLGNLTRRDPGERQEDIGQRRGDRQADRGVERESGGGSGRSERAGRTEFPRAERVEIQRPERVEFQRPERVEIQRPERPERSGGGSGRH